MPTLRNPKNPTEEFTTELTEEQAFAILQKSDNDFARSLVQLYPNLSPARYYWFFKLAVEAQPAQAIKLHSNLAEFIKPFGILQFKMGELQPDESLITTQLRELGKIKFVVCDGGIAVMGGYRLYGQIRGDEWHSKPKCPPIITAQLLVFSRAPVEFLELFGKATGHCCICGRLLTNEGSVERGIGPICAERYGV